MSLVKRNTRFGFPSLLDDLFMNDRLDVWGGQRTQVPAANIKETENDFQVALAAPGFKKEDFNIDVEDDVLTVSSSTENTTEVKEDDGRYTRKEFSFASFSRSFSLPEDVKQEEISATYTDGVLTIVVPKNKEVQLSQKRTIAIS